MAPAFHDSDRSDPVKGDPVKGDSEKIDSLIWALVVSFTLISVVFFGLCACCGEKAKKKKKEEPVGPRYLEVDIAPPNKSTGRKSDRGKDEPVKSKKDKDKGDDKQKEKEKEKEKEKGKEKAHYFELDPPPVAPFKSDKVFPEQKAAGTSGKATTPVATEKPPEKPKSMKAKSAKEKLPEMPFTSVVKKPSGSARETAPAAKGPTGLPMQFVHEDDPRYRSLYQLDDAFEDTMLKASMRKAPSTRGKPDVNTSTSAAPPATSLVSNRKR